MHTAVEPHPAGTTVARPLPTVSWSLDAHQSAPERAVAGLILSGSSESGGAHVRRHHGAVPTVGCTRTLAPVREPLSYCWPSCSLESRLSSAGWRG
eukprot:scaffold306_cov525-Prasinococcus_capsulatus_cf.AAC.16